MVEREVVVQSDAGVHARPAMMMVRKANKYPCKTYLIKGDSVADCKSIMAVISLVIHSGTKLVIRAEGEGEAEVVDALVAMICNNFAQEEVSD